LREAGIGIVIGIGKSNIYRCTQEEVITVLESSLANAQEIFVVQLVDSGFFELVPRPNIQEMWNILLRQSLLSDETLSLYMILSQQAWDVSSKNANEDKSAIKVFGTDIYVAMLADEASLRWVKVNLLSMQ
jgi:hypothetical protein